MHFTLLFAFGLLSICHGRPGDSCSTNQGRGTCQSTASCTNGFTWPNACPNDAADVKCCIQATCTGGTCLDRNVVSCTGGTFKPGLCPGGSSVQCCQRQDPAPGPSPAPGPVDPPFVAYLRRIYALALQHGGNKNPNQLVMEWLRHVDYNNIQWTTLIGGIDDSFITRVEAAGVQMLDTWPDPEFPGLNAKISHFGACMNGVFTQGAAPAGRINRGDVTGWGGDWITFYGNWRRDKDQIPSGGDYARLRMANLVDDNTFKMRDLVEDADCYNIGLTLKANPSLSIADEVAKNFADGYKTRMRRFVNGRFGTNAQGISKEMLLSTGDLVIEAGRAALVRSGAEAFFVVYPAELNDNEMNDLTGGFRDRLNAIVREEAGKYP